MILDNFIVEQFIGLVDGVEHNAAFLSVSVLTTAPAISQDSSIAVHRSPGNIAHAVLAHQTVAQAGRVSRCANQSGCMMPGTGDRSAPSLGKLLTDGYNQLTAAAYTTGTGTGQPTGVITGVVAAGGSVVNTVGSDILASGDAYALQNALPPRFQANAQFCANLSVLNALRQF